MFRRRVTQWVAAVLVLGIAAVARPLAAQGGPAPSDPSIDIVVPSAATDGGPLVRASNFLIADAEFEDLLRNGFPARLSWRVELWSAGTVVNEFEGGAAWEVLLRFDPVPKEWVVTRIDRDRGRLIGRFDRYSEAARVALDAGRVPVPATKPRRHYYLARLTVEVLSVSDLTEAERWLRGELSPAVQGKRNPGSAIGGFFRAVAMRLLGSKRQTIEGRSATFVP